VRPRLVYAVGRGNGTTIKRLEPKYLPASTTLTQDRIELVIGAMRDVVHGARGTARRIATDALYTMAGKTGTAQVVGMGQSEEYDMDKLDARFHDHALFIAFAPIDAPRIALVVIAENGGSGSRTAAPIARTVMDYYLRDVLRLFPDHYEYSEDVNI
jgi:penicillin-binding protein 2